MRDLLFPAVRFENKESAFVITYLNITLVGHKPPQNINYFSISILGMGMQGKIMK
jgi:hypothetical protein